MPHSQQSDAGALTQAASTANKAAYDTNVMARLWQVSADLVGMTSG